MADNIALDTTTNQHAFMARGAAWHHLGQTVTEAQTWEEAMRLAHLDWTVRKDRLFTAQGAPVDAFGIFRDDNDAFLGAVGDRYSPIQNRYQFDFVDAILAAEDGAHYETAGALGKGERVFCLAKIGADFEIAGTGDRHETYLLFVNSHDGTGAARALVTTVRVVCQNTLNAALRQDGKAALRIKHTKNAESRLNAARELVAGATVTVKDVREKLDTLAQRKLTKKARVNIMSRVFNAESKKGENTITNVMELFERNDNDAVPEIRGTAYNMLNAFTEFVDHNRPVKQTDAREGQSVEVIRADHALFGTGAQLKNGVLEIILEETEFAPYHSLAKQIISSPVVSTGNAALLDDIVAASM